jgi:hypothetical protein
MRFFGSIEHIVSKYLGINSAADIPIRRTGRVACAAWVEC